MTKCNSINVLLSISLLFIILNPAFGGTTPTKVIKKSNETILDLYGKSPTVNNEILDGIFSVMDEITDFKIMAERAAQDTCKQSSPESCKQLKLEFIQLLKLTATNKLGRYRADRFEYHGEDINDTQAIVKTTAHYEEDEVQLDYVLEKRNSKWVVVNYITDEVDTIRNYRSQFNRITAKKSPEFLINRLKKKNEHYLNERAKKGQSK